MSDETPVKRARGRPRKSETTPKPVTTKQDSDTVQVEAITSVRPGRKRSVPAWFQENYVDLKLTGIKTEPNDENGTIKESSKPDNQNDLEEAMLAEEDGLNSPQKKKRGRPAGWKKYADGETPVKVSSSWRPRGRPTGSLGRKKKSQERFGGNNPLEGDEEGQYEEGEEFDAEEEEEDISLTGPPLKKMKTYASEEEEGQASDDFPAVVEATTDSEQPTSPRQSTNNPSPEFKPSKGGQLSLLKKTPISESLKHSNIIKQLPTMSNSITGTGKRQLFVKTKDGKLLRLPDNVDSLKFFSKNITPAGESINTQNKVDVPGTSKVITLPTQKLSLVGAQQVEATALQNQPLSNMKRIDELMKATPVVVGKIDGQNPVVVKPNPMVKTQPRQTNTPVLKAVKRIILPSNIKQMQKPQKIASKTLIDAQEEGFSDKEEDVLDALLPEDVDIKTDENYEMNGMEGFCYQGNQTLSTAELLFYSFLHFQGALLHYSPEKRTEDRCTLENIYKALKSVLVSLPGDVDQFISYARDMEDLKLPMGKICGKKRWRYFFPEVTKMVQLKSGLLSAVMRGQLSHETTQKLLTTARSLCGFAKCRMRQQTLKPSGYLQMRAGLKYVLELLETRPHHSLSSWNVKYIPEPEMIAINRTLYNTHEVEGFQVITVTVTILPSFLYEVRINNKKMDLMHLGLKTPDWRFGCPVPLERIEQLHELLQKLGSGSLCIGVWKSEIKKPVLAHQSRGNKIYHNTFKDDEPIARIENEMVRSENCTVLCAQNQRVLVCGACAEVCKQLQAINGPVKKSTRTLDQYTCKKTGLTYIQLLHNERQLNRKLNRQVARLKGGIAKFCMPGPYRGAPQREPGLVQHTEHHHPRHHQQQQQHQQAGFSGEVDSEEIVMATSTVEHQIQQEHQGEEEQVMEVPLEEMLMQQYA